MALGMEKVQKSSIVKLFVGHDIPMQCRARDPDRNGIKVMCELKNRMYVCLLEVGFL